MMRLITAVTIVSLSCLYACSTTGSYAVEGSYDSSAVWAAKGSWTDSCCCDVVCPCMSGSAPTRGHCDGVTLIQLQKAHYDGVNLDGLSVVAVYRSGNWVKYIVSDNASKAQTDAVVKLLPQYVKFLGLSEFAGVENAPIIFERSGERIKYSTAGTVVEMTVLKGNNGKPIKLENFPADGFPSPAFIDHTQYKSVVLQYGSKDKKFEYEGTNAFTAQLATVSSSQM